MYKNIFLVFCFFLILSCSGTEDNKKIETVIPSDEKMAKIYDTGFDDIEHLNVPYRSANSTHVFHQYTLKTSAEYRDQLIKYLCEREIPAMIYYPVPLYRQEAFSNYVPENFSYANIEKLCNSVFSLPIHSERENSQQEKIIESVRSFFNSI